MAKQTKNTVSDGKLQSLNAALAQIQKNFGSGAIMKMDGSFKQSVETTSSGSLLLDMALGVNGLPYGRIVEIFGPESSGKTTLTLSTIAEAQKTGKTCAFIDAEHAFDPVYAQNLGVNMAELLVSQPSTGEEALEIADTLVNSGAVDVIVIDSVAGLVPKAEIEGEMGDSHVGLQARLMSQALRKLTGSVQKNKVLMVFINQIRMKIGISYGCAHGDTEIFFTDGRSYPIREIVENKIQGNVWSYNEETKCLEEKPIIDWHFNGNVEKTEDYINISFLNRNNKFTKQLALTPDHEVLTVDKGWVKTKDLKKGDKLFSKAGDKITGELLSFVKGLLFSKMASIERNSKEKRVELKIHKNSKTKEDYFFWKLDKLKPLNIMQDSEGNYFADISNSNLTYLFKQKKNLLPQQNNFKKKIHEEVLLNFDSNNKQYPISIVLCFLEHGFTTIHSSRKTLGISTHFLDSQESVKKFSKMLHKSGYNHKVIKYQTDSKKTRHFIEFVDDGEIKLLYELLRYATKEDLEKLEINGFFSPESWKYLLENNISHEELQYLPRRKKVVLKVMKTTPISKGKLNDDSGKYDLTVQDNHNYLAGGKHGFIIHNSPETTTGGNALKFYSSVRLDIRKIGTIKKGDEVVGNQTKVKVIKNKVAPPFREAEFEILYGKGINRTGEILEMAVRHDFVQKSGAWYSMDGNKIGQGKDNVITWLNENQDVREELYQKIININDEKGNESMQFQLSEEDKAEIAGQDSE